MVEANKVEFLRMRELTEETRRILFDWAADPFCAREWGLTWRPKTDHLLVQCAGLPASHVGLIREVVYVNGVEVEIGGLGDVITVPEFQRRGLSQQAIGKALEIIWDEWELKFAMLFCFPALRSFYERMGWTVIEAPVSVAQPSGRIRMPAFTLAACRHGEAWPAGEVEVKGLPW